MPEDAKTKALRGNNEIVLEIGDRTFHVRPTFQIIAGIEAATGKGIPELAQDFSAMRFKMTDVAQILYQMTRRQKGPTVNEIGEELSRSGVTPFVGPIADFLSMAFVGNPEMPGRDDQDGAAAEGRRDAPLN